MAGTTPRRGRSRTVRFSVGAVMGAVLATAVLLAILVPRGEAARLAGFPPEVRWSHELQRAAVQAEWIAIAGVVAGAVVLVRSLLGGAAPSRAEWLAIALAVFAAVEANAASGDAMGRAVIAATGGWVEVTGLILPAFSPATVGMAIALACLIALRRAEARGALRVRAPLVAVLASAMFWGPLPALANWASWSVGGWAARLDLARLVARLLYALVAVAAIGDFARARPDGPRRRATEWAALASWLLLALAWTSRTAASGVLTRLNWLSGSQRLPVASPAGIVEIAGPAAAGLAFWLATGLIAVGTLRLLDRIGIGRRPDGGQRRAGTADARPGA